MPLLDIPTELLYMFTDYLHPRDHSALTLTNRQLAALLQPRLLSRLRSLPLHDPNHALLALHWAAASANLPRLKELLETVTGVAVIDNTPPPRIRRRVPESVISYTSPGPCPLATWTWVCARGASLRLFHPAAASAKYTIWTPRGLSSSEYAITTHHLALLRLSIAECRSHDYARYVLRYAARHGRRHTLEVALAAFRRRFGTVAWDPARAEALCIAVEVRSGRFLIGHDDGVKACDSAGRTLLHRVVAGFLMSDGVAGTLPVPEVVRAVLLRGADVDAVDNDGATPLHSAAGSAHVEVVQMLLMAGAAVNKVDNEGCVPAHRALRASDRLKWEVVELLRLAGANFDVCDGAGVSVRELLEVPMELRSSRRGEGVRV